MGKPKVYTAGPWHNDNRFAYAHAPHVVRRNGLILAVRGRDARDEDMALMAAAPALLEALKLALRAMEDVHFDKLSPFRAAMWKAKEAIADACEHDPEDDA